MIILPLYPEIHRMGISYPKFYITGNTPREKKDHAPKTPPDPLEIHSSHEHSPRDHDLTSDEETRIPSIIITQKKIKPRKNRFTLSHDEISRDESEDGSCDHETTSDLSDSHPKKHHFHFPSFHSLWNHKKPSLLTKKERDGEHSNGSEHDNDTDRSSSSRRLRDSDSQSQKRHNISHRFILIDPVEGPNVNTQKTERRFNY